MPAVFIHDTRRIIHANDDAQKLFRCDELELIDRDLLDFIPEWLQDMTRFNLYTTRKGKGSITNPRRYDFLRCDGTTFSAEVSTRQLEAGQFETVVTWRYEVR